MVERDAEEVMIPGSWFLVLGSWFLVLGSWFLVLDYPVLIPRI
ncbi:hypothetical protein ACP3V5_19015 [Vibrio maritimus]